MLGKGFAFSHAAGEYIQILREIFTPFSFPKTAADSFSKASSKAFAHKSVNNRIQGAEMKLKLKVYLVRLKLHFWP